MSGVADRLESIRERVEAATEGPECSVQIESLEDGEGVKPVYNLYTHAEADQRYLLSLVEEVGEALNRVSITPNYMEHEPEECREAAKILFALRDAAQEGGGRVNWDFNPREDLDMKEPIVHEGKTPDWESHEKNAERAVQGGKVNWQAAMMADPGAMSCPNCDEYLWRCGKVVECPHCGHVWDRREEK